MMHSKTQRGETIIEVLLSIAVMSLVLAGSYTLANRSLLATRQSQERSEALKITESQIESFKYYLSTVGSSTPAGSFCMLTSPSISVRTSLGAATALGPANGCKSGPGNRYNSYIEKSGNTYTATTKWYRVTGTGIDEVKIYYRLY